MKRFNYDELPFEEIVRQYSRGASWREFARHYGCPDHKTLASHVKRRYPHLDMRNQAQSQRARRERDGTSRNKTAKRASRWLIVGDNEG